MDEQTLNTNSEELELGSAEGEQDVPNTADSNGSEMDLMKEISQVTGREFKDLDDFQKHYKELSSFVGKNPKELEEKAKLYDEQIGKAKNNLEKAETSGSSSEEISVLRNRIEEMELLKDAPEASRILGTIRNVASAKKVSLKEAYDSELKDLLTTKLAAEKREQEERNPSVESKPGVSSSKANKIASLTDAVRKTDSSEAKEALVREFLQE